MRNLSLALVAGALFSLGTLLWPAASHSQGVCFPLDYVLERLGSKYNEAPVARGVDERGNLALVTATLDGSTWTIFVVNAGSQLACVVGAGSDWESIEWEDPVRATPQSF